MFTIWPEDIQQNADIIHYFNAEMGGGGHEKSGDCKRNRKWQMHGYTIYPK